MVQLLVPLLAKLGVRRRRRSLNLEDAEPIDCMDLSYPTELGANLCTFACSSTVHGEAILGLLPGVMATQVGVVQGCQMDAVRVLYDNHVTSPFSLEKQVGLPLLDLDGTDPFKLAPMEDQKATLQRSPLSHLLQNTALGGRVLGSSLLSTQLNAFCYGLGTEKDLWEMANLLDPISYRLLVHTWEQRRDCVTTP
eukprot:GGOE01006895.1.p1 GENE.GGOE01006895.1~~GGOE01006895.1.p1  ORF type:complete len:195 (-),score=67.23 GGOE01006895.1:399-983(-)